MEYVLIVILILFSAFFSGSEIAYTAVNRIRLKQFADDGNRVAALAVKICDKFEKTLITLLIGNNIVNIAMSSIATTIAYNLAGGNASFVAVSTTIITVLIIIFGEILPKVIFKRNTERFSLWMAYPLMIFIIVFSPVSFVVAKITQLFSLIWGKSDDTVTESELVTIIETAEEDGGIDEDKSDLLQNAIEFSDITLSEIITHRKDVVALDVDDSIAENLKVINSSRYSRLPVYKENIDNIVGMLNINHYYKQYAINHETTVEDVMREPLFMPGTVKLPTALETMREDKVQIVVVLDEYGGTLGIVTMEDILEQIVGDIWDESDEIIISIKENGDGTYKVLGEMNVYDMFDELDVDDRDFESDCNTVGGWCAEVLEQTPEVGMAFDYKNLHVEITSMEDILVEEVCVTVNELPKEEDEE
ncbi:MAG: HlyC/CorC family transporter [Ruminococcaceae bacterium]|nr:HlyC/CorC family transporter [Oscillospiraceae bacterium]